MRARRLVVVIGLGLGALAATAGCREVPVIQVRFAPLDLAGTGGTGDGGAEAARAAAAR